MTDIAFLGQPEAGSPRPFSAATIAGGLVFVSTLNRTARSLLLAKIGAEYVMRLLPVGTHDWRAFVTPAELAAGLRGAGLRPADMAGLLRDPFTGDWRTGRDLRMNYIAMAEA